MDESRLAFRLRDVHRDVGVPDQVIRRFLAGDQAGDPDAGPDGDLLAINGEGRHELPRDPLGDAPSDLLVLHPLQQHRELVTPQAGNGVTGPQRGRDAGTDRDQQLVADVVAQRVINGLEIVEVQE